MSDVKTEAEAGTTGVIELSDFETLLQQEFKPRSEAATETVRNAVATLAEIALRETTVISDDVIETIRAMIAEIDQKLTDQVNAVLHHEDFRQLEGGWRGLSHLVMNSETDEMLKIRVLNVSKDELGKTLKRFKGAMWDQSPIFKKFYGEEYDQLGGDPYGCLVGDYYFDHSPKDVELLTEISKTASAAHAPFLAAAAPSVLGMDSYGELANPRDLSGIFTTPEYAGWRSLREADDSRYIGLTMPRFLARLPYGAKTEPVEDFAFEEDTSGATSEKYVWANAAYAMALNITQSFKAFGWCTQIRGVESGGTVDGLPTHTFPTDDGGVDMKCPTEIAIGDRREAELAKNGFMPLVHRKNTDMAAFIGAQSLNQPQEFDDADATANSNLSARLPYMFTMCRFAHYLKCIVRDKIGSFKERDQMESWLNSWIYNYVEPNPALASDADKARRPLAAAEVRVVENEGNPGFYDAKFSLRPHYQLEGLNVSLSLVSKLPSVKG